MLQLKEFFVFTPQQFSSLLHRCCTFFTNIHVFLISLSPSTSLVLLANGWYETDFYVLSLPFYVSFNLIKFSSSILQTSNFKDCNLSSDILQKHSINSLLEHNDDLILSRSSLSTPTEGKILNENFLLSSYWMFKNVLHNKYALFVVAVTSTAW